MDQKQVFGDTIGSVLIRAAAKGSRRWLTPKIIDGVGNVCAEIVRKHAIQNELCPMDLVSRAEELQELYTQAARQEQDPDLARQYVVYALAYFALRRMYST
jgi:hypothetical protein